MKTQTVRLSFYKAQFNSLTDLGISLWTKLFNWKSPPYSHVEIGFFVDNEWCYFSSSIRDGGTRWKHGKELLKHPERWDVYEKEYDDEIVERMIKRAVSIMGKKYDFLGILGFLTVTGQVLNSKDAWYCSEAVIYILTGVWIKRISPRSLYKRIKDAFSLVKPTKEEEA